MIDTGHWVGLINESNEVPFGFIYQITNLVTDRKYIGKKQCKTLKKKAPLKGKKKKRCSIVETDWKNYTSSSKELNEDIKLLGKDKFKFEIIKICNSKWSLSYYEAKIQFEREVLLSDEYYNGIINLRVGKKPKSEI